MVALWAILVVLILATAAEALHARRVRRVARLAFGPAARPAVWARWAGVLRVLGLAAVTWGLTTLLVLEPKAHRAAAPPPKHEMRHLLLVLDVSPSMRLTDAGPTGKQSRAQRVRDLVDSLFARVDAQQNLVTIVAVYNGALPVVQETRDAEVVRNILDDLPMQYAFESGGTDLFAGLREAARVARPWRPHSATLVLLTDGDTVPATGMPPMPVAIEHALVVGVGDSRQGSFIDGRHSKQDASTLRQLAARLKGIYHDGNQKHLSSALIAAISATGTAGPLDRLSRREYALAAAGLGATLFALLPMLLQTYGARWRPGTMSPGPTHTSSQPSHRIRPKGSRNVGVPS